VQQGVSTIRDEMATLINADHSSIFLHADCQPSTHLQTTHSTQLNILSSDQLDQRN
jgi:hypothetical protein